MAYPSTTYTYGCMLCYNFYYVIETPILVHHDNYKLKLFIIFKSIKQPTVVGANYPSSGINESQREVLLKEKNCLHETIFTSLRRTR